MKSKKENSQLSKHSRPANLVRCVPFWAVALVACAIAVTGTGCGTISHVTRGDGQTYFGTKSDIGMIRATCQPRIRSWHIPTVFDLAYSRPVYFCVAVLDLPISLVSDTLLLPYDLYLKKQFELTMVVSDESGYPVHRAQFVRDSADNTAEFTDKSGIYHWPLYSTQYLRETYVISKPGYYDTLCLGCAGSVLRREMATLAAERAPAIDAATMMSKNEASMRKKKKKKKDSRDQSLPRDLVIPVVLKSIRNPVPMIGRRVFPQCPKGGEPAGFDLGVGDWVAPHGKGVVTDILILSETRPAKDFVRTEWRFPEDGNGIQSFMAPYADQWDNRQRGSALIPPHKAPVHGYTNAVAFWVEWPKSGYDGYPKKSEDENRNYIFRIRAGTNTETGAEEANVGWIRGDVSTSWGDDHGAMSFEYYFNPDPTSISLEATKNSPFTDSRF